MNKQKKIQVTNITENRKSSALENEIVRIVEKAMRNSQLQITAEDAKIIAKEVMPDLDKMISDKVRGHFFELGEYMMHKFKP